MTDSNNLKLNCLIVGRKTINLDTITIRGDATVKDLVARIQAKRANKFEGVDTSHIVAWDVTQFDINMKSTTLKDDIERLDLTNKHPTLAPAWQLWQDVFEQALPLKGKLHILVESRRPSE